MARNNSEKKTSAILFSQMAMFGLGLTLILLGNALSNATSTTTCQPDLSASILRIEISHAHQSVLPSILISAGGVLFGIALSTLIGVIFSPSQLDSINERLADLAKLPWKSYDTRHSRFRDSTLHGYLLSQNKDGSWGWRYREFDFSADRADHYLKAVVSYHSPDGEPVKYTYFGILSTTRLILIGFNELQHGEREVVQVFPDCSEGSPYAGYAFLETPSKVRLSTRTLLSTKQLTKEIFKAPAFIPNDDAPELHRIWRHHFRGEVGAGHVFDPDSPRAAGTPSLPASG